MTSFVLDNSVTMRWCFENTTTAYAEAVLDRLQSGEGAVVPTLWRYEVSAVLARAEQLGSLTSGKATEFIANLKALDMSIDGDGTDRILTDVYRLAVSWRLTAYDAAYLELAIRRGLPLATLDGDLRRACRAAGAMVVA